MATASLQSLPLSSALPEYHSPARASSPLSPDPAPTVQDTLSSRSSSPARALPPTAPDAHLVPDPTNKQQQQPPISVPSSPASASTHTQPPDLAPPAPAVKVPSPPPAAVKEASPPKENPPTPSAPAEAPVAPAARPQADKPKGKGKQKAPPRSPSPLPAPPPPPLTVRLNIPLGGPDNYAVSILELTRLTGQRHPTPPPARRYSVSSSDEEEEEKEKPAKRRKAEKREYDLTDPFIDDSDLIIDAPTHFAQTKQKGFYVSSGEVALVKDEPVAKPKKKPATSAKPKSVAAKLSAPTKPKSRSTSAGISDPSGPADSGKRPSVLQPLPDSVNGGISTPRRSGSPSRGLGTRDSPIALLDDSDQNPNSAQNLAKRMKLENGQSAATVGGEYSGHDSSSVKSETEGGTKKRKLASEPFTFHPDVAAMFEKIKGLVANEPFEVKTKFPPALKEPLAEVAMCAVRVGNYGDPFFDYLPKIFPYNRFTMMKLTRRLIYTEHQAYLQAKQEPLLEELKKLALDVYPHVMDQHAEAVAAWEEKQKKKTVKEDTTDAPTAEPTPNGATGDAQPAGEESKKEEKPPQKRFKWTEPIKKVIWDLVGISNDIAAMTNTMHEYEKNIPTVSEQGMRKTLYQKIVAAFPEGWMTSTAISREVSMLKKKYGKEQQEGEAMDEDA
ncbi:hypothetical protein BOTBODRAFT_35546 [Botryobasidium botryosum FD-172 SS1]|uniref:Ubinuclein middle domain-containing protein n=1 Tax=Botryobasidium botryosum (strain FD-172 SS1) TaxID=930990 RepID=A0A067MI56_BOTB1|nr:hypothetical protein BOTBODRAFT_35546 [Botryobasidium botryosum FD-172 SS1]